MIFKHNLICIQRKSIMNAFKLVEVNILICWNNSKLFKLFFPKFYEDIKQ